LKHLIWDLDGTLIDSQAEILHTLELALRDSSLNITEQIKPIRTGPPLELMLKESFSADIITEEKLAEILSHFRKHYDSSGFEMTKAFEGIDPIIFDTDNFTHHIVTNKPNYASTLIIKKLGWSDKISSLRTPSQKKSKSEFFAEIIAEFGNKASVFAGIGDMKTDCIAAKNNNIISIGVLWGSGTREELQDYCDELFYNAKQLNNFLYNISNE